MDSRGLHRLSGACGINSEKRAAYAQPFFPPSGGKNQTEEKRMEIFGYLKNLAEKTIADCTFIKNTAYGDFSQETKLLLPSGDEKYMSFWVRDCAMMAESGLIPNEDLKRYVDIIAACGQNGAAPLRLENGLTVPPFAVADHINYNGKPVFFPGTYADGTNQGDGAYGFYPPFCDNYYFILMAAEYVRQSGDSAILRQEYQGLSLLDRLEKAFAGYQIDPETELCRSQNGRYTVDWGFVDCVRKDGLLLMASLLRYNAGKALEGLFAADPQKCAYYRKKSKQIAQNIRGTFWDEATGWLYSATGTCRQHDIWGTAYAVYTGVLETEKTLESMKRAYLDQTAVAHGYIRHILTNEDASETSAWENSCTPYNTYQNGAYWATPLGWYIAALYPYDADIARQLAVDFIEHTERYKAQGAPFEWINADTTDFSGKRYGTSGVLPYIGYQRCV